MASATVSTLLPKYNPLQLHATDTMLIDLQRYVLPLISPPTPPQLEADKASIDASFARAFALIDQLTTDTAALAEKETQRTERLDTALKDVDAVVGDLKAANTRREAESRIIMDQINGLKDQIPKALEGWKAGGDARLEELGQEMQSLKRLLENRVGRSGGAAAPNGTTTRTSHENIKDGRNNHKGNKASDTSTPNPEPELSTNPTTSPKQEFAPSNPRTFERSDRKAIPAWQRAASEKNATTPTSSSADSSEGSKAAEAGA